MRSVSTRTVFISSTALSVAVLWGAVECLALAWSRLRERFRLLRKVRVI
jgi:hypothetical protein